MLAGYITANTSDLALVNVIDGNLRLENRETFTNKDFSDFESILRLYLKNSKKSFRHACFGVAGPVIRDCVATTNLPWKLSCAQLQEQFELTRVRLVNDLVACAQGALELPPDKFYTINEGIHFPNGNMGMLAAGTGLGEALMFNDGNRYLPYASEGGHADFAPTNQIESELRDYLFGRLGRVEAEDVVSLSGIENIYCFLSELNNVPPAHWYKKASERSSAIIEQGLSGEDELAVQTLDLFIDCYASEAANLALKGMTLGGIRLGGLIAPQIITALDKGRFMERFAKGGKMEGLLSRIPVQLIIDDKTALLGAASLARQMR
ncbi:MAG: glucokinase [Candidatus Zixiibacteriota bacterium]